MDTEKLYKELKSRNWFTDSFMEADILLIAHVVEIVETEKQDKDNVNLADVRLSLPSHIKADEEAKMYANKMNGKRDGRMSGFSQLDFYNGTLWLRQQIEDNEA